MTIVLVSCFALVAHAATDWDDLKSAGLAKNVRLEPPEYAQEEGVLRAAGDLLAAHLEDRPTLARLSVYNPKAIKLNLRI